MSELKVTADEYKNLATNLQVLLLEKKLSENDIAQAINLPVMTVRRIVSGETEDPRISTLKLLANYLNVTIDSLLQEYKEPAFALMQKNTPTFVPILDWKTITNIDSIKKIDLRNCQEWQPIASGEPNLLSKHAFAVESRPSMQPRFPLGTLFIIEPNETPNDSDLVLIKMKKNGELSLRELIIDPPKWQLLPIISGSEILFYEKGQSIILGVVVLTMLYAKKNKNN